MKVVILRGIQGSGKSSYIAKHFPDAEVCSADNYFMDEDGNYNFNPAELGKAHESCLHRFVVEIWHGQTKTLVVDNTNVSLWEISPYLNVARAFGHEVEIVRCEAPAVVAAERNVHGVPLKTVIAAANRMERLPPFWPTEVVVDTSN